MYGPAPFGYVATAGSGRVLLVNETLLAWLRYTRGELQAEVRFADLLTPGGRLFYETHLAPILIAGGSADEVALDLVSKQGAIVPTLVNGRQTRDGSNGWVVNRWTIFKASERRMYERDLVSARHLFETTLLSIGDGVITTSVSAAVTFLNRVAADLSGCDPDLAAGRPIEDVLILSREDTGELIENPIRQALRTKGRVGLDNHTILVSKNGTQCVVDDSAAPLLDDDGELLGAVMAFRDISGRRRAERALGAAYQDLEAKAAELRRSNEALSQFAYVASHDLRSPLKTVIMYSQLLQRRYSDKLDSEGMELISEIESATKRLGNLIEDLLAFSTVSSNPEYPPSPIDADVALGIVRDNLQGIITESGATVDSGPLPKLESTRQT